MKVVVVRDVIVLIGGGVIVVRRVCGNAFLSGVSQGVMSACCGVFTLQSCGLGFSLGGDGACQGGIARCIPGGRTLARSGVSRGLHLGVRVQGRLVDLRGGGVLGISGLAGGGGGHTRRERGSPSHGDRGTAGCWRERGAAKEWHAGEGGAQPERRTRAAEGESGWKPGLIP